MNSYVVLACEVLRPELEQLAAAMNTPPEIHFLQQGLHDAPGRLREQAQEAVLAIEGERHPARIVLAYGLCGRGLAGVRATACTLVIPKVHDCIPLLLGQKQDLCGAYSQGGSTFWMSPGWLHCSQSQFIRNRKARHADYAARFDEEAADYLMDLEASWLASYKRAALIRWDSTMDTGGIVEDERGAGIVQIARMVAADAGLPYAEQPGNPSYLRALLEGGNDRERFFHLAPGETMDINADGALTIFAINKDVP